MINIYVGSKNPSKINAVNSALDSLGFDDYQINPVAAKSKVSSKPSNQEIIEGAINRNADILESLNEKQLPYDYVVSIEGGFEEINNNHYLISYAVCTDKTGKINVGKSIGMPLTPLMYSYTKKGGSLNKIIESILNEEKYKETYGISGYLSNGLFRRETVDRDAVISSMLPFVYKDRYDKLDEGIKLKNTKKDV